MNMWCCIIKIYLKYNMFKFTKYKVFYKMSILIWRKVKVIGIRTSFSTHPSYEYIYFLFVIYKCYVSVACGHDAKMDFLLNNSTHCCTIKFCYLWCYWAVTLNKWIFPWEPNIKSTAFLVVVIHVAATTTNYYCYFWCFCCCCQLLNNRAPFTRAKNI